MEKAKRIADQLENIEIVLDFYRTGLMTIDELDEMINGSIERLRSIESNRPQLTLVEED